MSQKYLTLLDVLCRAVGAGVIIRSSSMEDIWEWFSHPSPEGDQPSSESLASAQPSIVYASEPRVIYTPRKSIPIPSRKEQPHPNHPQIHTRNLALPINGHFKWMSGSRRTTLATMRLESHPRLILTDTVRGLDERRDHDEKRILHAYDHLEENHSKVQHQQIKIESLDQHMREAKLRLLVSEIGATTLEAMIGCLQQQLAQIVIWLVVYFRLW
ncbi:unnamed protein product [Lactuca saligna]|uniref:Uncharacterized protein n=1 Tax=Lactuca saligna TaxID=75948 RepID=A0AA35YCD6_LACSI|nr:unnamed protein product [Lactuca saligna]